MINFLVVTPKPTFLEVTALISCIQSGAILIMWCAAFWRNSFEATIIKAFYMSSENVFTLTQNFSVIIIIVQLPTCSSWVMITVLV